MVLEAIPADRQVTLNFVRVMRREQADEFAQALAAAARSHGATKYYGVIYPDGWGHLWHPRLPDAPRGGYVASPLEADLKAARSAGLYSVGEVKSIGSVTVRLPVDSAAVYRSLREDSFEDLVVRFGAAATQAGLRPRTEDVAAAASYFFRRTPRSDEEVEALLSIFCPPPGKLDAQFVARHSLAHAWLMYTSHHRWCDNGWLPEYELVTIDEHGGVLVRSIPDGPFLDVLSAALTTRRADEAHWNSKLLKEWKTGERENTSCWDWTPVPPMEQLRRKLIDEDSERSWALVPEIVGHLDKEILEKANTLDQYAVLHAQGDRERSVSRLQMTSAYAGAVEFLTKDAAGQKLLRTIDSRRKLAPAFAKALKTAPWVVRRIATTPKDVLQALSGFDDLGERDWFRRNGPSPVAVVARRIQLLGAGVRLTSVADVQGIEKMIQLLGGGTLRIHQPLNDWMFRVVGRHLPTLGRPADLTQMAKAWEDDGVQAYDLQDYFRFVQSVIAKAAIEQGGYVETAWENNLRRALGAAFEDVSLPDIRRWCLRYHSVVVPLLIRTMSVSANGSEVPPLLQSCELPVSGWTARQLIDPVELRDEGERMEHCVYTYARAVQVAATTVFSLRSTESALTVQMQCSRQGAWSMVQARGKGNRPVESVPGGSKALEEFLEELERSLPEVPKEVRQHYTHAVDAQWQRLRPSFFDLVDCFGLRAWTSVRNCMPGSAHGRLESKLWIAYSRGNTKQLKAARR